MMVSTSSLQLRSGFACSLAATKDGRSSTPVLRRNRRVTEIRKEVWLEWLSVKC